MKKLFAWGIVVLGIWLAITPWLFGYESLASQLFDSFVGVAFVVFGLTFAKSEKQPSPNWQFGSSIAAGAALIISSVFIFGRLDAATFANELVIGILALVFAGAATQIVEGKKGCINTKDGGVLVELSKIGYKDGVIVMKGKAFGSMPQAMRLTGEQIAYILGMVPFEVVAHLPKILFDGWRATRKASEEEK